MPGLDINLFREDKGGNPNLIRKSLERRFRDTKIVDVIIEKDHQWRKGNNIYDNTVRYNLDSLKK